MIDQGGDKSKTKKSKEAQIQSHLQDHPCHSSHPGRAARSSDHRQKDREKQDDEYVVEYEGAQQAHAFSTAEHSEVQQRLRRYAHTGRGKYQTQE